MFTGVNTPRGLDNPPILVALFVLLCLETSAATAATAAPARTATIAPSTAKSKTKAETAIVVPKRAKKKVKKQIKLPASRQLELPRTRSATIKYTPFTAAELPKARGASATTKLPTRVVNGKRVTVSEKEYIAELNRLEREFNKMGITLHGPAKEQTLYSYSPRRARLVSQRRANKARIVKQPRSIKSYRALVKSQRAAANWRHSKLVRSGQRSANNSLPAGSLSVHRDWEFSYGDPDMASAFIDGALTLNGSTHPYKRSLDAEFIGHAGTYILGDRWEVITVRGIWSSRLDGQQKFDVITNVGGQDLAPLQRAGQHSLKTSGDIPLWTQGIEYNVPIPFGPVYAYLDLEVGPTASLAYNAELDEGALALELSPRVAVEASAELYVNAWVASAGASGEATLLDYQPTVTGAVELENTPSGPRLYAYAYARQKLTLLSGRIYAYVRILWSKFTFELLDEDGIHYDGYLFWLFETKKLD